VVLAGLAPDLDGLSLLGGVDAYGRWHHLLFHGALGAAVTAAACAAFARRRGTVAALAVVAFHLHLVCDLAGSGPGWPIFYFWPLNRTEWMWDGQWDLASWQNSVIGMGATVLCLLSALVVRRTAVELFSLRADAAVTAAVRRRFLRQERGRGSVGTS
jgi:hypothetical protein